MGELKAFLWPLILVLGILVGVGLGNVLDLGAFGKLGLLLLFAFAGFMLVILTHSD